MQELSMSLLPEGRETEESNNRVRYIRSTYSATL